MNVKIPDGLGYSYPYSYSSSYPYSYPSLLLDPKTKFLSLNSYPYPFSRGPRSAMIAGCASGCTATGPG